jgi:hypothetical protein
LTYSPPKPDNQQSFASVSGVSAALVMNRYRDAFL